MTLQVRPQGRLGAAVDWLMKPIMYVAQGTVWEEPQRTHFWNNVKLRAYELQLREEFLVTCPGDETACDPWWYGTPLFHLPAFGGWREFVVLEPTRSTTWHVGWVAGHGFVGVSRIPLRGGVRMTIGPGATQFFGLRADGEQLPLRRRGYGRIGEAGVFRRLPLL